MVAAVPLTPRTTVKVLTATLVTLISSPSIRITNGVAGKTVPSVTSNMVWTVSIPVVSVVAGAAARAPLSEVVSTS